MPTATKIEKKQPEIESNAREILELTDRVHAYYRKEGNGVSLTPVLARKLKELSLEAKVYFQQRIAFVERLANDTSSEGRLREVSNKISTLSDKEDKQESDYQQLATLERMRDDLETRVETKNGIIEKADAVLKMECLRSKLPELIATETAADIVERAAKAIAPFCVHADPFSIARNLPLVADASLPIRQCQNVNLTGVTNATNLVAFITRVYPNA